MKLNNKHTDPTTCKVSAHIGQVFDRLTSTSTSTHSAITKETKVTETGKPIRGIDTCSIVYTVSCCCWTLISCMKYTRTWNEITSTLNLTSCKVSAYIGQVFDHLTSTSTSTHHAITSETKVTQTSKPIRGVDTGRIVHTVGCCCWTLISCMKYNQCLDTSMHSPYHATCMCEQEMISWLHCQVPKLV